MNYTNDEKLLIKMLLKAKELTRLPDTCPKEERRRSLKQAINIYQESLRISEGRMELLDTIAYSYIQLENVTDSQAERKEYLEQAIIWTRKAVEKSPDIARLHALLGYLYHVARLDYQETAKEYRIAIALAPCDATIYIGGAHILYGPPESPVTLQEAIEWVERAVQLAPDNADYLAYLGRLYSKGGRSQDAVKTWISALISYRPLQKGFFQEIQDSLGIE
jgi:tetratricopeptide (TPR) repeat protein